jgi:C_GCAxxG_C_C family probable redox protein
MILKMMRLNGKGYCCAQIILILALEAQGKTNADLVRSVGGLCYGINWSGEVCGALSGGACLISLYAGKGADEETPNGRYMTMVKELVEWFTRGAEDEYGGTRCHEILERFPDRSICSLIVAETYKKCMDILVGHGFDIAVSKNG